MPSWELGVSDPAESEQAPQSAAAERVAARLARAQPDILLADLDGTLLRGNDPLPGAASLLAAYAGRVAIITNNSSESPAQIARRMRRAGLRVPEQAIVTAGFLLVEVLAAEYRGQPILLLAGPVLRRAAAARGLDLVDSQAAEVVAIARHETFGYRDLAAAANAIGSGAACIAANPDLSHPGTGGYRVPETGALVAAIQAAAGTPCPVRFVGKPEVLMAKRALERIGAGPEAKAAVLGDNPHTDGALAKAIGAAFVLVSGSL